MTPLMEKLAGMGCDMNAAWNRFLNDADFLSSAFENCLKIQRLKRWGARYRNMTKRQDLNIHIC